MTLRIRAAIVAVTILFCSAGLPANHLAFSNVELGETVTNEILLTLSGGREGFLGEEESVHLFFFFKPDKEHSLEFLNGIEALRSEMKDRSIHWTAIVSDRFEADSVSAAVSSSGLTIPVLIDEGDQLFGKLGVTLHPVVGMTDQSHTLKAYVYYRKVNLIPIVRAHILHILGEIDDEQLANVLEPKATIQGGDTVAAQRTLKLARMLFKAGKVDKALPQVEKSIGLDSTLVSGHILLGEIWLAKEDKEAAAEAFQQALNLDPLSAEAKDGLRLSGDLP